MEQLNSRIKFLEIVTEVNENGFNEEVEKVVYSCWCNVKTISFKEMFLSGTTVSKKIVSFKVRKCNVLSSINEVFKISFKDNLFDIVYVNDDDKDYVYYKGELVG